MVAYDVALPLRGAAGCSVALALVVAVMTIASDSNRPAAPPRQALVLRPHPTMLPKHHESLVPCRMAAALENPETSLKWSLQRKGKRQAARDGRPFMGSDVELHVAGCNLTAWIDSRVPAVRQCFQRLGHVVFVGDSVTRFSYVSLVHFLHTGSWMPRWGPPGDLPQEWQIPLPKQGVRIGGTLQPIDFPRYFLNTTARLDDYEVCDCHVGSGVHVENRYYARDGVKLAYTQFFSASTTSFIHEPRWLNVSCGTEPCIQAGCAVGACAVRDSEAEHNLRLDYPESMLALPRLFAPDVMVFNSGLHRPGHMDSGDAVDTLQQLVAATALAPRNGGDLRAAWDRYHAVATAKHAGGIQNSLIASTTPISKRSSGKPEAGATRFVWRTTTPLRNEPAVMEPAASLAPAAALQADPAAPPAPWPRRDLNATAGVRLVGGRVFDAWSIAWPLFVQLAAMRSTRGTTGALDRMHLAPAVNAAINRALIAYLCEDDDEFLRA